MSKLVNTLTCIIVVLFLFGINSVVASTSNKNPPNYKIYIKVVNTTKKAITAFGFADKKLKPIIQINGKPAKLGAIKQIIGSHNAKTFKISAWGFNGKNFHAGYFYIQVNHVPGPGGRFPLGVMGNKKNYSVFFHTVSTTTSTKQFACSAIELSSNNAVLNVRTPVLNLSAQ
ncbi:MAG: hypothetical protein A3F11_08470 [Gammaproteobacteria bacterium RIFCSPHIGHO2_12_FULL_37_14]|nr:MAG: hypothetical protein A3F11_08470 [Gammaproteobacteria bacterium RIFCSPHIGHO2_12_FULL_37_14]